MKSFSSSELKTIIHSKRANFYYLEYCRIVVNGGRVEYITDEGAESYYWNIPIANTIFLLLGSGTSVTQAAMRELGKAGVVVGFSGGDGAPLFTANELDCPILWMNPQSEYRPTEYLQQWVSFWFDDQARLDAAKIFQNERVQQIRFHWEKMSKQNKDLNFDFNHLKALLNDMEARLPACTSSTDILSLEAKTTKGLYKIAANAVTYGNFTRGKRGDRPDLANRFLDHGNYLAYGLGATTCWVLGLPHGLPVLHGKTRRGGLVFDVADIIKDAFVLPLAFLAAMDGDDAREFRKRCLSNFNKNNALEVMIKTVQKTATTLAQNKKVVL